MCMGFSEEKKARIRHYLLEKIQSGQPSAVKRTAEAFGVTPATVYKYLDKLEAEGVVEKRKRDEYRLSDRRTVTVLRRSAGELEFEASGEELDNNMLNCVIQIIRQQQMEDGSYHYGCVFTGMPSIFDYIFDYLEDSQKDDDE